MLAPDERAWSDFLREYVAPLRAAAGRILGYLELLRRELDGSYVAEAARGPLGGAVVGGLLPSGSDAPSGSRRLHSELLGLSYDVDGYLAELRSGSAPASRLSFRWTPFVGFVSSVAEAIDRCILPGAAGPVDVDAPRDPEGFLGALAGFMEAYLNLSPARNPVAFFAWSLRKNWEGLLSAAYPSLGPVAGRLGLSARLWAPGVRVVGYPEYDSAMLWNSFGPSARHGLLRRFLDAGACRSPGGALSLLIDSLMLFARYGPEFNVLRDYLEGLEDPASTYFGLVGDLAPPAPCESGELRGSTVRLGDRTLGLAELLGGPAGARQFYGLREYFLLRGPHGTRIACLNREAIAR